MTDIVVTVPKNFTYEGAPGKRGLAAWLAEGDPPGAEWSGQSWCFTTWGGRPRIEIGERVYVVCEGRLVGYSPLTDLDYYEGEVSLYRQGGAVACTIRAPVVGFRGWRYRWWEYEEEIPIVLPVQSALFQ